MPPPGLQPAAKKNSINKFKRALEKRVKDQDALNKKTDSSSGGMLLKHNIKASEYNFCRLGVKKWL